MNLDTGTSADVASVSTPPDGCFPKPPTVSSAMSLPFGELSWENFERLCHRLALRSGIIDAAERYGRQGQAQQGIDIFARQTNGRYEVWQAKRHRTFGVAQVKAAVAAFLKGKWAGRTDRLILAVQSQLDDVAVQEEIELQAAKLAKKNIAFVVLGGDALVERLRPYQDLVLAFFGRAWLHEFYGDLVDASIMNRLDGEEFARARSQVSQLYKTRFSDLDQGIVSPRFSESRAARRPLALLDRYEMTDVYVRDRVREFAPSRETSAATTPGSSAANEPSPSSRGPREELRRVPANEWLADGDQIAVIADAGAGKSTLLRCVALDLLGNQTLFPALGERWGERLPLLVSFAKWARATEEKNGEVSLKELVAASLQPLLTVDLVGLVDRAIDENRIVLILDGLDEWSAEQAARLTLSTFLTWVEVHRIPVLASGRPLGLRKIGSLPQSWKTAELAPLSAAQQRQIVLNWFSHLLPAGDADADAEMNSAVASWQAERLLKELRSEPALGELSQSPLLLVGLLALAIRDVALPRDRVQALASLVRLLLEVHPQSRATASGDAVPRFKVAVTPEMRESALGALAFASRRDGGDAGYPRPEARRAIRDHLSASHGYDVLRAEAVADEILAVNAETVGLIVEKGPMDIGFVHSSLEEYLSALHLQSWAFDDLIDFAKSYAGDPRWRNVLRNVVALNTRASEISDLIHAIEGAELDLFGEINRDRLLAEITFTPSKMNAATARRLADKTFAIIDGNGPEAQRADLLRPVLNGLGDPVLDDAIQKKIRGWAPRRMEYAASLYRTLRLWDPDDLLLGILMAGLRDPNWDGARAAAQILAAKFSDRADVGDQLAEAVNGNADLQFAAAALESLVIGWPAARTDALVTNARRSRAALLRSVAIWAKTRSERQDDEDLAECLRMLSFNSSLDYMERSNAREALFSGWPDDDRVVTAALQAEQGGVQRDDALERDLAVSYLLKSTPGRPEVEQWILTNLDRDYPFISSGGGDWGDLVHHCQASSAVHEKAVARVLSGAEKYHERQIYPLIARSGDPRLRDHAIEDLIGNPERFGHYWSLLPLVEGWSDDPLAKEVFAKVIALKDDEMGMLVDLLPRLYNDPVQARARLIRIARDVPKARHDLIAGALAELKIDGRDDEAVDALLPHATSPSPMMGNADIIFALLADSHRVQAAALVRLTQHEPPIAAIAHGMREHPLVRAYIADLVQAVPAALRSSIVAACGTSGDRHQVFFELLNGYNDETDFNLRVQLAIDFYRLKLAKAETDGLVDRLLDEADRVGHRYEENRAVAFAGLLALGQIQALLDRPSSDRDILLGSWYGGGVSSALCDLVVEHWDALKVTFGDDFVTRRLKSPDTAAWSHLAHYVGSRTSARRDFLDWCDQTAEIDGRAIAALAEIAPRSDILQRHLFAAIDRSASTDDRQIPDLLAAARILADQFPGQLTVDRVRALFQERPMVSVALVLAFLAPDDPALKSRRLTALELGETHGGWVGAVEMAARMEPADMVVTVIHRLSERAVHPRWDRGVPLNALTDRILRDFNARDLLRNSLEADLSADAFCASAVILAGSGALDAGGWDVCMARLAAERNVKGIPTAALDITTDQIRPVAHILSDLLQTKTSL